MEKLAGEILPEDEAFDCGRNSASRRVRMKKGSLFAAEPAGGRKRFLTKRDFFSYGRMNALFARQAAFERWGSKNEWD